MRRMIFCNALSLARRSATASTAPQRLLVPARTLSPTPFSTGAPGGRAGGAGQNEKMDIDRALLQQFPDFERSVPAARDVGRQVTANRPRVRRKEIAGQPEGAAQNRRQQLRFPFVGPLDVFEE